jgi:hypothetical protein
MHWPDYNLRITLSFQKCWYSWTIEIEMHVDPALWSLYSWRIKIMY